jgi:hypothetical protein
MWGTCAYQQKTLLKIHFEGKTSGLHYFLHESDTYSIYVEKQLEKREKKRTFKCSPEAEAAFRALK